jgi:DNA-directed RNA polymerase subunit omega
LTTQHALLDAAIKKIGNRYLTTMLIAKRIRQLYHGARPLVEREEDESYFTVAVREIAEGHLTIEPTVGSPPSPPAPAIYTSNGTADDITPLTGTDETS